jgi:protein transport protein SEC24
LVYSGSDAVYKLRCSNGIHVKKFLPSNNLRVGTVVDTSELEFSRVNADTCIAIELDYDIGGIPKAGGGKTNPIVYFQTALLYTTMTGRRRLRVSTLALPTTTSESEAFKAVRFGATCTLLTRKAIDDLFQPSDFGNLKRAGSLIMDNCVNILANYRHFTEAKHNTWDTLVLPETLGLLPLFCLGLRKSLMFRSSLSKDATQSSTPFPNGDERAYRLLYGSLITPMMSMLTVHPNLFSLLDMKLGEGEWSPSFPPIQDTKILSHIVLPEPIPSSVCQLKEHGIYILDDGFTLYLFIGRDVSIETRADLLSYDSGEPQLQSSSELAKKIVQVINQIRRFSSMGGTQEQCVRPAFPPLILILGTGGSGFRKGVDDALEKAMIECCVDDTSGGDSSYGDFLCEVHRRVKEKQKFLT